MKRRVPIAPLASHGYDASGYLSISVAGDLSHGAVEGQVQDFDAEVV